MATPHPNAQRTHQVYPWVGAPLPTTPRIQPTRPPHLYKRISIYIYSFYIMGLLRDIYTEIRTYIKSGYTRVSPFLHSIYTYNIIYYTYRYDFFFSYLSYTNTHHVQTHIHTTLSYTCTLPQD